MKRTFRFGFIVHVVTGVLAVRIVQLVSYGHDGWELCSGLPLELRERAMYDVFTPSGLASRPLQRGSHFFPLHSRFTSLSYLHDTLADWTEETRRRSRKLGKAMESPSRGGSNESVPFPPSRIHDFLTYNRMDTCQHTPATPKIRPASLASSPLVRHSSPALYHTTPSTG